MTNLVNAYTQPQTQAVSYKGKRVKHSEVEKLLKYVNNESLTTKPDTFKSTAKNAASSALLFEGIPLANMLRKSKALDKLGKTPMLAENAPKVFKDAKTWKEARKLLGTELKQARSALFKKGGGSIPNRIKEYLSVVDGNQKAYSALKSEVAKNFKVRKVPTEVLQQAAQDAAKEAAEQTAKKAPSLLSRAGSALKTPFKKAGAKIAKKIPQGVKTAGTKAKGLLKTSGAGFMLAIDGAIETGTEVIPTFKELGAKKGWKQVGKSAVKVVGNTAGYILGAKAGAAIGSFICPGIGTAVGAACGFIGGLVGQFITGKITKKIVGPSEREKAQAEQQKQAIADIAKDPQAMEELKAMALAKIQEEAQYTGGELSKDAKVALRTLENIEKSNPFVAVV